MATTAMSTVDKALSLLRHFSVQSPELGLSELARAAGYDKTTTLRCMTALARNGFVEQDAASRKYRLGLAPINLARIREHSFPVQAVLKRHLDRLAAETGETAHASLITGGALMTAMISAPERAACVGRPLGRVAAACHRIRDRDHSLHARGCAGRDARERGL
jgi:IclR family acetate operon transcriptional repressor